MDWKQSEENARRALGAKPLPGPKSYTLKPDGFLKNFVVEIKVRKKYPFVLTRAFKQLSKYCHYFLGRPGLCYLCTPEDPENGLVILRKDDFLALLQNSHHPSLKDDT